LTNVFEETICLDYRYHAISKLRQKQKLLALKKLSTEKSII
jgi:hypothetical protein